MTGVRMGRRPLLAMALGWVLVVAAVAAVTFVVVDRAGRGVGQASAARTVAPLPSRSVSPPPSPGPATSTATPSSTPTPVTARSAAAPSPTRTSRRPTPTPTPAVRPAGTRTASFTTEGGTVVASCAGTVLTLGSITPRDGWRFEKESEHGGLEVKFTAREEDVDDVEIVLGCVRGTPTRLEG